MNMTMQIPAAAQLHSAFQQMSRRVNRKVSTDALMAGAKPVHGRVVAGAPVEPGAPDLKNNINYGPTRKPVDGLEDCIVVAIWVPLAFFYDWFQEFGTSRHPAQPFYRPAFDGENRRAVEEISRVLWLAIRPQTPLFNVGSRNL